jgi:hypothetical protein
VEDNYIEYKGYKYWYKYGPAKHRESTCLATKNPKEYCNGFYQYSDKDPGSGFAFVITRTDNPNSNWMDNDTP